MPDPVPPTSEVSVDEALRYAIAMQQNGDLANADKLYARILEVAPDHAATLNFLGVLRFQQGDTSSALEWIRRSIAITPDSPDAYNNLANICRAEGKIDDALAAYKKAVELAPGNVDILLNYASVLEAQRKVDQALEQYELVFQRGEHISMAYRRAGRLLRQQGRTKQAEQIYERWLAREPDNAIAKHLLAACRGKAPPRASDEYVQATFDGFASSFDKALSGLDYRAPQIVVETLSKVLSPADRSLQILDAGCGTGLCGDLVRPYAKQLVGVDLSQGMLEQAAVRDVYDSLIQMELAAYMQQNANCFDVALSADTLIYFGQLPPVFAAAGNALRSGGFLVFSLEQCDDDDVRDFVLNPHGRYSHREDYVRESLDGAGFKIMSVESRVVRNEGSTPVSALVVLSQR